MKILFNQHQKVTMYTSLRLCCYGDTLLPTLLLKKLSIPCSPLLTLHYSFLTSHLSLITLHYTNFIASHYFLIIPYCSLFTPHFYGLLFNPHFSLLIPYYASFFTLYSPIFNTQLLLLTRTNHSLFYTASYCHSSFLIV